MADYLAADLAAVQPAPLARWRPWHRIKHPTLHFQRRLRFAEFRINTATNAFTRALALLARHRARQLGQRLGFTIPPNVFGPGLSIPHWGTIIVNDQVRVGARCRLHASTNIGVQDGRAPRIGDDCYIGPGAKLYGDIALGHRVVIGANAVVNRSCGDDCTLVGVPARARPR